MSYAPIDILEYVIENEKEADFTLAMSMHKGGYSIGEIPDIRFVWKDDVMTMKSNAYKLNETIEDPDIMIACKAGKYISVFLSRYGEHYQIHFLVHECLNEEKPQNEEEITERVVQYMILKTIKQLRLDTPEKIDSYLKV